MQKTLFRGFFAFIEIMLDYLYTLPFWSVFTGYAVNGVIQSSGCLFHILRNPVPAHIDFTVFL